MKKKKEKKMVFMLKVNSMGAQFRLRSFAKFV